MFSLFILSGAWMAFVACGVLRARPDSLRGALTPRERRAEFMCLVCNYDRRGIGTSDPCPECGIDPTRAAHRLTPLTMLDRLATWLPLLGIAPSIVARVIVGHDGLGTHYFGFTIISLVCISHAAMIRAITDYTSDRERRILVLLPLIANIVTQASVYTATLVEPYDGYNHWLMFASTPVIAAGVTGWAFTIPAGIFVTADIMKRDRQ